MKKESRLSDKTVSSQYLSDHPYFRARKDSYQMDNGKLVEPYFVVELPPSVVAMALTAEEKVLLVKQYRYPVDEILTELPGGFIDEGEEPAQAVRRELHEETGYSFSSFHYLGSFAANPGVLDNYTHFFLATGGEKTGEQQPDPNEEIEIILKSLEEVKGMLDRMEFRQSLHALCLFYGLNYLDGQRINAG